MIQNKHYRIWILPLLLSGASAKIWSSENYPNPSTEEGAPLCGRGNVLGFVCDPDGYLSSESADVVEGHIKQIQSADFPYGTSGCREKDPGDVPGFQLAVAVLSSIKKKHAEDAATAAERFTNEVFDNWGVGNQDCENGVLLMLAVEDRQVFIAKGKGVDEVVSREKLQEVIFAMRPSLREADYDQAVERAVIDIGLVLAGGDPESHDSHNSGWAAIPFIPIGMVTGFVGLIFWGIRNSQKSQREATSLLEKLQQEQESARTTGKYPATSCPICFEDLQQIQPSAPPMDSSEETDNLPSDEPDAKQPLLTRRKSRDKVSREAPPEPSTSGRSMEEDSEDSDKKKPLRMPCGHTFCVDCISEWLKKNTKCPVCRAEINPGGANQQQLAVQNNRDAVDDYDLYNREVGFRLHRLRRRYPGYISQAMVDRAVTSTDRGGQIDFNSLRQQMEQSHARSNFQSSGHEGSSISFGGGSHSGGGVGGSW